jgi:hypothetical protein
VLAQPRRLLRQLDRVGLKGLVAKGPLGGGLDQLVVREGKAAETAARLVSRLLAHESLVEERYGALRLREWEHGDGMTREPAALEGDV